MSESFDPYLKWLGIRKQSASINHYRLLGVDVFEDDPDVLANAAERQIGHIRSFRNGPHQDLCDRILGELNVARDT
ncbi:MAG: hypothetical protein AAGA30_20220 [Planctomycetota bacterium]